MVLLLPYFNTRELAAVSVCAALWGVLNALFGPIFFRTFGLPVLCDLIGFSLLIIAAHWIRKFGAITTVGLIATIINFALGGGIQFLGFTAASIFFDILASGIQKIPLFTKSPYSVGSTAGIAVVSSALAGYLIGLFFMAGPALANWGGVLGWAGLHMVGGVIGGAIGTFLILALSKRNVLPQGISSLKLERTK
jgi:hypothetical protein